MKKIVKGTRGLVAVLVMGLLLSGCGSKTTPAPSTSSSSSNEPYKIGVLTTQSGPFASFGQDISDTIKMEVDLINGAGGINGHKIELVSEDDGADNTKAVTGMTKLIEQGKVLAVIGTSITVNPVIPVGERAKVPMIMSSPAEATSRAMKSKYAFFVPQSEFLRAETWLDFMKEKGWTRAVGFGSNLFLALNSLEELKKQGASQGVTVDILPDSVETTAMDVTPQVTKLKALVAKTNAQVLVATTITPTTPLLLKTMKQLGVNIPVLTWDGNADPLLIKMGGDELNGLFLNGTKPLAGDALPDSDKQKPVIQEFTKRYQAKYNKLPGAFANTAFDSVHILANALKISGGDRSKLRDAIEGTKDYVGLTGVYNYSASDHEGLTADTADALYQIQDKKFVFLRVAKGKAAGK